MNFQAYSGKAPATARRTASSSVCSRPGSWARKAPAADRATGWPAAGAAEARRLRRPRRRIAAADRVDAAARQPAPAAGGPRARRRSTTAAPGGAPLAAAITALARTRIASAGLRARALRTIASSTICTLARARRRNCCGAHALSHQRPQDRQAPAPPALDAREASARSRGRGWPTRAGALADGAGVADSAALLRNLGNLPGERLHAALPGRARPRSSRARIAACACALLNEAQIRRLKMGCFLAVTRGSAEPPRFIVLEYRGGRRGAAPVVLVGKGITFDTGGISLKDPPPWTR